MTKAAVYVPYGDIRGTGHSFSVATQRRSTTPTLGCVGYHFRAAISCRKFPSELCSSSKLDSNPSITRQRTGQLRYAWKPQVSNVRAQVSPDGDEGSPADSAHPSTSQRGAPSRRGSTLEKLEQAEKRGKGQAEDGPLSTRPELDISRAQAVVKGKPASTKRFIVDKSRRFYVSEAALKLLARLEGIGAEPLKKDVNKAIAPMMAALGSRGLLEVLRILSGEGEAMKALAVLEWMKSSQGAKPSASAYGAVLSMLIRLAKLEEAEKVLDDMISQGIEPSPTVFAQLIQAHVRGEKEDGLNAALATLGRLQAAGAHPNTHVYDTLIAAATSCRPPQNATAERLFEQMKAQGLQPTEKTYLSLIEGCKSHKHSTPCQRIWDRMIDSGFTPTLHLFHAMLNVYCKNGYTHEAMHMFLQMNEIGIVLDSATYRLLFYMLGRKERMIELRLVYTHMLQHLDRITLYAPMLANLVMAFGRKQMWQDVESVIQLAEAGGIRSNPEFFTALLGVYGKFGHVEKMERELAQIRRHFTFMPLDTYNMLLEVHARQPNHLLEVTRLFAELEASGTPPNQRTFTALIHAFGYAGHFEQVDGLAKAMEAREWGITPVVYAAIMDVYGSAGRLPDAWRWMRHMRENGIQPHLSIYNRLMLALGVQAVDQAVEVLEAMQTDGVKPNVNSYRVVIEALAQAGQVEEALRAYRRMLQSRFRPDAVMVGALAAHCWWQVRTVEAAQVVNDIWLVNLLPSPSCTCVLMAAYGAIGHWQEAEKEYRQLSDLAKESGLSVRANCLMLEAYVQSGRVAEGRSIIAKLEAGSFLSLAKNQLIRLYGRAGKAGKMVEVFQSMLREPWGEATTEAKGLKVSQVAGEARAEEPAESEGGGAEKGTASEVAEVNGATFAALVEVAVGHGKVQEALRLAESAAECCVEGNVALFAWLFRAGVLLTAGADGNTQVARLAKVLLALKCPEGICRLLDWEEQGEPSRREGAERPPELDQAEGLGDAAWEAEALEDLRKYSEALEMEDAESEIQRFAFNSLIDLLWVCGHEGRAAKVMRLGLSRGMYPGLCRRTERAWTLNVRHLSAGPAQVALLTWLADMLGAVKAGEEFPPKIEILLATQSPIYITGSVEADFVKTATEVRDVVVAHARHLRIPFALVRGATVQISTSVKQVNFERMEGHANEVKAALCLKETELQLVLREGAIMAVEEPVFAKNYLEVSRV